MVHVARVVVEEIGIGLIVGLALTWLSALMLDLPKGAAGLANTGWKFRSSRWRRRALQLRRLRAAAGLLRALSAGSC